MSEDLVPRQPQSSSTPSYSYQGTSTPVASSNRQSPTFFGTAHSPTSNDESSSLSARFQIPNVDENVTVGQYNGSSVRPDQIMSRIRPPLKMTMTDLLAQEGVSGYNANQNLSWQVSIPPIEVINLHQPRYQLRNPDDAILTALRNVAIKFDSYDKYCVQETLKSINTHIVTPLEHSLTDNSVNYTIVKNRIRQSKES